MDSRKPDDEETENIILINLDFLPLKTNANIVEANALRIDWNDVIDRCKIVIFVDIIYDAIL